MPSPTTPTPSATTREPDAEPGRRSLRHHRLLALLRVLAFVSRWFLPDLLPDVAPGLVRWFDELTRSLPGR